MKGGYVATEEGGVRGVKLFITTGVVGAVAGPAVKCSWSPLTYLLMRVGGPVSVVVFAVLVYFW